MSVLLSVSQGYPQALLPLTVAGIPSIHICLDFIPELLAQPQLEKQVRRAAAPLLPHARTLDLLLLLGSFPEPFISPPHSDFQIILQSGFFCDFSD